MQTQTQTQQLTIDLIKGGHLPEEIELPEDLSVLTDGSKGLECGMFRILNQADGDKRIAWNRLSIASVRAAKDLFNKLILAGLKPFRVDADGKQDPEMMTEFDPAAEEVIFAPYPMLAGG